MRGICWGMDEIGLARVATLFHPPRVHVFVPAMKAANLTALVAVLLITVMGGSLHAGHAASTPQALATEAFVPAKSPSRWAYEAAVAWITPNEIDDFIGYGANPVSVEHNDAGGNIYYLTASYHLGDLPVTLFGKTYTPRMELPLTLAMFDENSNARSPFMDYNAAFSIRWVDFPWNRWLVTSVMTGVGFSYSAETPLMDYQRHPGENRSKVKFNWPIQLSLALPQWPEHQLIAFIDHQSGGHLFDAGGINSIGLGYRYQPK